MTSSARSWALCFAAIMAVGCNENSPVGLSSENITYAAGATCNPADYNRLIACEGDPGTCSSRYIQYCDPNNGNRATACTVVNTCADGGVSLVPPPYSPSPDGGTGCSTGAWGYCTTSDGRLGVSTCDATGVYGACAALGAFAPMGDAGAVGPCGGDPDIGTPCTAGLGACAATGTWECNAGIKSCNAAVGSPATETCDGVDNDCDGTIDESVTRSCYSGAAGTATIGICRFGTQTCAVGGTGTWGACAGEVLPGIETCGDGIDQDCNGADLGCTTCGGEPLIGTVCTVGIGACSATGNYACNASTGVLSCSATAGASATETCNNLDDDCNGTVDSFTAVCYSGPPGTAGVGICRAGTQLCTAGVFGACTDEVLPRAEICGDGIDQDCNGADLPCVVCGADPRLGTSCSVGLGQCLRSGIWGCVSGSISCSASAGTPVSESCNNLDDDCNGAIDNGLTRSCYTGTPGTESVGVCRVGSQTCTAGAWSASCAGEVLPSAETCGDGIDQDCSGGDLTCGLCGSDPLIGTSCTVGVGACERTGTFGCSGSTLTCSAAAGAASVETCNNVDDDCNGTVDNLPPQSCYSGPAGTASVGICRAGSQTCTSGAWSACAGEVLPGTETACDGIDQDCNGSDFCPPCYLDPLYGSIGATCTVGVGACQRSGIYACSPLNVVVCSASPGAPGAEICGDGIDQDCNGSDLACTDAGVDAGMDAGVDSGVADAGVDSGATDGGTVVVSGGRYTIEVGGRACTDASADTRWVDVAGYTWWRFCYQTTDPRPSTLMWTQWGDWTDTSSLPSVMPSVSIPAGTGSYTVNVYMRFSNAASVTIEPNIQIDGTDLWAVGISGPPTPPVTTGVMYAWRISGGTLTAYTLDPIPNVPCNGLNFRPRGTACRASSCSYAASYPCL